MYCIYQTFFVLFMPVDGFAYKYLSYVVHEYGYKFVWSKYLNDQVTLVLPLNRRRFQVNVLRKNAAA